MFTPDPLPGGSSASASATVPGTTTSIELAVAMSYDASSVGVAQQLPLAGTCTVEATTIPAPTTTTTAVAAAADVPAVCAFLEEIQAIDVGDPASDDPSAVLNQLDRAIDGFRAAADAAPADVAGDVEAIAAGLFEIRGIVAVIVEQQSAPTAEQQEQIAAVEERIRAAVTAVDAWAGENCGSDPVASPAQPVAASPSFTG